MIIAIKNTLKYVLTSQPIRKKMKKAFQIAAYTNYYLKAKHWRGHGIHSPFMYDFVRNTLMKSRKMESAQGYKRLLRNLPQGVLPQSQFGANPGDSLLGINALSKRLSLTRKYGKLLNSIVGSYQPKSMLELGTGLGVSAFYLANGNPTSHLVSIDGMECFQQAAMQVMEKLSIKNVELINSSFDAYFESLGSNDAFDLIFIDGSHTYESTIENSHKALKHITPKGIIILDDIRWSKGMFEAWSEIKQDKRVRVSIDLGRLGILFVNSDLQYQEYTIRY